MHENGDSVGTVATLASPEVYCPYACLQSNNYGLQNFS